MLRTDTPAYYGQAIQVDNETYCLAVTLSLNPSHIFNWYKPVLF